MSLGYKEMEAEITQAESDFIKEDDGKPMVSLVEPQFILGVAKTMTFGAEKYGINNWQKCGDIRRYKDALLRHTLAFMDGEITDPDTGLSHMYHAGFNAMAIDYLTRQGMS